ncbi:major facilitator superfamily domain-containing protein [Aspergillus pseudoustus]|uniref:Major facilitator superfamily domain-containing protein n=1 Tax=Aspergillus pseudoustus TaxID=1810923 RepID=A0ABR4INH4_9EURO
MSTDKQYSDAPSCSTLQLGSDADEYPSSEPGLSSSETAVAGPRGDSSKCLGKSTMCNHHSNALDQPDDAASPFQSPLSNATIEEEKCEDLNERISRLGQSDEHDGNGCGQGYKLVTWDGPDDVENPINWPERKKWAATVTVSMFTFISPVSSSMVAPALTSIAAELDVTDDIVSQLILSIFILAYAVGPLFLAPLSEIYGRVIILQLSNLFFLVFNLACGLAQTKTQLIICRFFAGLGGSAPLAVGGGVLSDCFRSDQRGKSIALYNLAPLLGPAIGPIAGGFITEHTTWRWVFHAVTIADAVIQVLGLFCLRETYGPRILRDRAKRLRKVTGNTSYRSEVELARRTPVQALRTSLARPLRLILTQPIVQVLACYMTYVYGNLYLVLSTFPSLWTSPAYYNESVGIGGLNYICLGVGFLCGSQTSALLNDRLYKRLKAPAEAGSGVPEFRLPLLALAAVLLPAGLLIYGWTAQAHCHWILPNLGALLFGAGTIISIQCMQVYLVDAYTRYTASALAATVFLRSLAGFGFPLFAPYMYGALHFGWGNTVLALVTIVIGWPAPMILWRFGAALRGRSPYAAG